MIIGITGTNGAGKGSVVEHLVSKGFKHYSGGDLIIAEVKRRNLPLNRDSMHLVANDLRQAHHPAYLIEQIYERAVEAGGDAVLEAPRALAEGKLIKDKGGLLIAVDAPRELRYERIVKRGSAKDNVSFEEFSMQEDRELSQTDVYDQNILGVIKMADDIITNDGTLEELHTKVDQILSLRSK